MSDSPPTRESWRVHALASLRAHHRGLIWMLEAAGFLIGGLIILIALAAYRLEQGTVAVKFLTPQLVAWLDHRVAPLRVDIAGTTLRWSPGDRDLEVDAANMRMTDTTGDVLVSIPSVYFSVGFKALLLGRFQPRAITVESPAIHLQRGPAGNFYLRPGPAPAPVAMPAGTLRNLTLAVAEWVDRDQHAETKSGRVDSIYVHNGTIVVDDQRAGRVWAVSQLAVDVTRATREYLVTGNAELDNGADHGHVGLNFDCDALSKDCRYGVLLSPINPSRWAPLLPDVLARVVALDLPIGAHLSGSWNFGTGTLGSIDFVADAQAGQIRDPILEHGRYVLKKAQISGHFDPVGDRLDLAPITVDLGGPSLAAAVTVTGIRRTVPGLPITVALSLAVHNVPRLGMEDYWPPVPVPKTRAWVLAHVTAGTVKEFTLQGKWEIHLGAPVPVVKKALDGNLRFQGVALDYLHGLAPIIGLDATAKLAIGNIDFDATAGKVLGVAIRHATASIDGLNDPNAPSIMTIEGDLSGPARDGITFVSAPRLGVAGKLGITPDAVTGTLDGPLRLRFPLPKSGETPATKLVYGANFHLSNFGVVGGALGRDIGAGDVTLTLDPTQVTIAGKATIAGVAAQLSWQDIFAEQTPVRMRVHLAATVDDGGRKSLGIDPLPGAVHGPVAVDADATIDSAHVTRAAVKLDFANADLMLGDANWSKPAGTPGHLAMDMEMDEGHWRNIRGLDAHAPGLDVQGDIDFDPTGTISRAVSKHLVVGDTDAVALVTHGDDGWQVNLSGNSVDATGYVSKFDQPSTDEERAKAPPVMLNIDAGRLILGPDRKFGAVTFHAIFEHTALQAGDLKSQVSDRGKLDFHLDRPENGGRIAASTDDFGAAAHVLGLSDHVAGGSATLMGSCDRENGIRHFTARFEAKDYRLVRAPMLAKLLSLASFTSIASLLYGNGVPFTDLSADLKLTDGTLSIANARTAGNAIGLVGSGQYNFNTKLVALEGTLVPAYFFNSVLNDLPVVGEVLGGGPGGGLFGANFKVGGTLAAPDITANPLSILVPGALRDLFLFQAPRPRDGASQAPDSGIKTP